MSKKISTNLFLQDLEEGIYFPLLIRFHINDDHDMRYVTRLKGYRMKRTYLVEVTHDLFGFPSVTEDTRFKMSVIVVDESELISWFEMRIPQYVIFSGDERIIRN